MINALHLIWIVPSATFFGFILCAVLSVNRKMNNPEDPDWELK